MGKMSGFMLLEIAIALVLISSFFALCAGYCVHIRIWQKNARDTIERVNYASSCLELIRQQKTYDNSTSAHRITIDKKKLSSLGKWTSSLDAQESKALQNQFYLVTVKIEDKGAQVTRLISGMRCNEHV